MMVRGTWLFLLFFSCCCFLSCCLCDHVAPGPVPAPAPAPDGDSSPGASLIPMLSYCDIGDQNFLLSLKEVLANGADVLGVWSNDSSCCSWPGVKCRKGASGVGGGVSQADSTANKNVYRVAYLDLAQLGLNGTIDELAWRNLSGLEGLDLSSNLLYGSLPKDLGLLLSLKKVDLSNNSFNCCAAVFEQSSSLVELNLSSNGLSDPVPVNFSSSGLKSLDLSLNRLSSSLQALENLGSLEYLNVSYNQITGLLPLLLNCSALTVIDLSSNQLEGDFNADICSMKGSLRILNVSANDLGGNLSPAISLCSSLQVLDLGYNNLSGEIPDTMFRLESLTVLSMEFNHLVGNLSASVASLANLTNLVLASNSLSGSIPPELGSLTSLERLDLSSNQFTGHIPLQLSDCNNLLVLNLRRNNLTGDISLDFEKLPNITIIDLSFNTLSGVIPSNVSLCSHLEALVLGTNSLTGMIPPQLGLLKNLTTLSLSFNNLTGGIPPELDGCTALVSMLLTKNPWLGGEIPAKISPFPNLQLLAVGFCGLKGPIPDWIGNCSKLQLLDLSWNHFNGSIPPWISDLQHLIYLELSNNTLTGPIPHNLSTAPSFRGESVSTTGLVEVTTLVLFVRKNTSSGAYPQRYTKLSSFPPSLLLGYNQFHGQIPDALGWLRSVMALDLSHNNLTGPIPDSLSNMSNMYSLNLANNSLSGPIPSSLTALNFLALFDVSNNNLSGPIPEGPQFDSFPSTSFLGNPLLCGGSLSQKCGTMFDTASSPHSSYLPVYDDRRLSKRAILGLTMGVGVGLAGVLALLTMCILSRRRVKSPTDDETEYTDDGMVSFSVDLYLNDQLSKLSPADLVKATNNFDQSNIIGCGGFGLVFRATLSDGTHVAIKRLTGDTGQAEREVQAELLTLGRIQHKNLVALQGYCRFGSDRLLIYNYMENGSLDFWLHEKSDGGSKLDWPMRRRIALGTARGLAYLHQMCEPHIVHRDIKSSNILLNEKFEAHLADFGLARHLANADTHVTTELVGTLGYIPPEYGQAWIATLRGDVYSFGVVVLELLTRRRPVEVSRKKGVADLVSWVQQMKNKGTAEETFDVLLRHQGYESEMLQVLDVATMCVSHIPQKRPTIQHVVLLLEQVGKEVSEKDTYVDAGLLA